MILAKEKQLKKTYKKLINKSNNFIEKSTLFMDLLRKNYLVDEKYFESINKFISYGNLLIEQIIKRVFENKQIPHDEKIFSVFEPFSEWICKGKAKAPFELGKRVTIVEDQYGFILHSKIMDKQTDDKVTVEVIQKTKKDFPNLSSCSFGKGYYSKNNREVLSEILNFVVLPKKGKLSKKDQEIEFSEEFIKYRKKHSAVESAINALEVHGLDRCLDKGFDGFKRYVAMAVVSRNIQKIGAFKIISLKRKRRAA